MKGEISAGRILGLYIVAGVCLLGACLFGLVILFQIMASREDTDHSGAPAVAASAVHGGSLAPADSARVADLRGRALEISRAGRWEVLDVTWISFPPRSSLYVLLQRAQTKEVESRIVFHLVQQESPRFGDWAKLRQGDRVDLEFADQPHGSVYLGSFAGPQDYLVPGSAAP